MGNIKVRDAVNLLEPSSIIATEDEPIESIIERFAKDLRLRAIFVIDQSRKFKGVITRFEVLRWTKQHLGEVAEDFDWKIVEELKTKIRSAKAVDVVNWRSGEAFVRIDDPVSKAFSLMMRHSLNDLPVLNDAGDIIGDLKLLDLLSRVLKDAQTEMKPGDA